MVIAYIMFSEDGPEAIVKSPQNNPEQNVQGSYRAHWCRGHRAPAPSVQGPEACHTRGETGDNYGGL